VGYDEVPASLHSREIANTFVTLSAPENHRLGKTNTNTLKQRSANGTVL